MAPRQDVRFWPQMVLLADCLCAEIAASGLPGVCFCGVLAGDSVPLDYCTECDGGGCGMAWVRLSAVTPLGSEATATTGTGTFNTCTMPLVATVEVGIARCAPMPNEDGEPPTLAEQLDAAQLQAADMAASVRAIRCCEGIDQKALVLAQWVPLGPDGGCLGGVWSFTTQEA